MFELFLFDFPDPDTTGNKFPGTFDRFIVLEDTAQVDR